MKRTQIYLTEDQDRRLGQRATVTRCTKSQLIRQAIDAFLDQPVDEDARLAEFKAAVEAAAGSAPWAGEEYEKTREANRRGQEELERYWHGDEPDTGTELELKAR
ncbi:MAG TPA: CopG family transcriptional regulator [Mycobacteriales bacterium]|nr:CopG family transcriptional regulator [Mycobacteriales bacterium]